MAVKTRFRISRRKALVGYVWFAILFCTGCSIIESNFSHEFQEADSNLAEGRAVLLSKDLSADRLAKLFTDGEYIYDPRDAKFAAQKILEKYRKDGLPNLGAINKIKIPATEALENGGELFRERVTSDYAKLGQDGAWYKAVSGNLPTTFGDAASGKCITVKINPDKENPAPVAGVPVRILRWQRKTIEDDPNGKSTTVIEPDTLGFVMTNTDGIAKIHLEAGQSYSVLPIRRGFQYGREKGTTKKGILEKDETFTFGQRPHTLSPLDASAYRNIRDDRSLLVRSPQTFKSNLRMWCGLFLGAWLLMLIFTFAKDNRLRNVNREGIYPRANTDYLLMITVMTLTGISVLMLFGMFKPLTDTFFGVTASKGVLLGLGAMFVMSLINYNFFYNGRSSLNRLWGCKKPVIGFDLRILPLESKFPAYGRLCDKVENVLGTGVPYLILAILLMVALMLFGAGPEGSDAKVNLGPMQPSELCKYLVVFFTAAYFTKFAEQIRLFSQSLTKLTTGRFLRYVTGILIVIVLLMGMYYGVKDLGPGLIVAFTFIFLYAMAQNDLTYMFAGVASYAVCLILASFIASALSIDSGGIIVLFTLLWLVAWIWVWMTSQRRIHESAIFMNFVIFLYACLGKVLGIFSETLGNRFAGRTAMMWDGAWNNTSNGGDQIAQGLWSLATGGIDGMGLGSGSPSLVPAGHTDMMFTTFGEIFGWVGIVLVVTCFILLVVRTIWVARQAGFPFPFYLTLGIGIVTGVQFLFIVLGSMGLIPLSGVAVPLLSAGNTGLVLTMAMFGVVMSCSTLVAVQERDEKMESFNRSLSYMRRFFVFGGLVVILGAFYYQVIDRNDTLIRPARVNNTEGARVLEYNPRIGQVLSELHAGNIYDRKGVLLATSDRNEFKNDDVVKRLRDAGLSGAEIRSEAAKHKRRYYPFGNHTLFMLGDYNTRKVFNFSYRNPIGYLAESRHLGGLRGLDITGSVLEDTSLAYRPNRFMPPEGRSEKLNQYDYSEILPFLGMGVKDNMLIKEHNENRSERDLTLTIDVQLQMALQKALAKKIKSEFKENKDFRASVVVLNARDGDLLASANYPLPDQDSILMLNRRKNYADNPAELLPGRHAAITERDLGLTFQTAPGSTAKVMSAMAGLMGLGKDVDKLSYMVYANELIHNEKNGQEPTGKVGIRKAITKSSNNYFIHLIHDKDLYNEVDSIYTTVGARMAFTTPYFFDRSEFIDHGKYTALLDDNRRQALDIYENYMTNIRPTKKERMVWGPTQIAWGQGLLTATPLNMARVASIVANDGQLTPTRYVLKEGETTFAPERPVRLLGSGENELLKSYMQEESIIKTKPKSFKMANGIGGKTGTPERALDVNKRSVKVNPSKIKTYRRKTRNGYEITKVGKMNDAWYIFFVESATEKAPLAVAVRLERSVIGSSLAVRFADEVILPVLERNGYSVINRDSNKNDKKSKKK